MDIQNNFTVCRWCWYQLYELRYIPISVPTNNFGINVCFIRFLYCHKDSKTMSKLLYIQQTLYLQLKLIICTYLDMKDVRHFWAIFWFDLKINVGDVVSNSVLFPPTFTEVINSSDSKYIRNFIKQLKWNEYTQGTFMAFNKKISNQTLNGAGCANHYYLVLNFIYLDRSPFRTLSRKDFSLLNIYFTSIF